MRRILLWLPLVLFVALFGLVWIGLIRPADRAVRSALVGKPLPAFTLPPLVSGKPGVAGGGAGGARLINVFASWCIPCAAEAPQLMRLKELGVPIEAVAVRDTGNDVQQFLKRYGDPYRAIGDDQRSSVQMTLGSSGVPESFVVDGQGRIVLQHVGDIREVDVAGIAAAVKGAR